MDSDRSKLFLLSMVMVPACTGQPGGQLFGGGAIPTDDDGDPDAAGLPDPTAGGGGGGPVNPGTNGCEEYANAIFGCAYEGPPDYGDDGGAGTAGYEYESGGGYVPPPNDYEPPDPVQYCNEILGYYTELYGARCAAAIDDAYACLANFACQDLDGESVDELCAPVIANIDSACPGLNEPATVDGGDVCDTSGGGDDELCFAQYVCNDGSSFSATCTPAPDESGQYSCTCLQGSDTQQTVTVENPCGSPEDILVNVCDFPV